jgi:hypothetical protein
MRYTIIHHDVRKAFDLTLSEYMVCDSIHQLSHQFPTTKSSKEIGEWSGVHKDTVNSAKATLRDKGLISDVGDGVKTTDKWYRAVTFASGKTENRPTDGKSVTPTENPSLAQYIYNKDITSEANASHVSEINDSEDEYSTAIVDDNGNEINPTFRKKDTSYRVVFNSFAPDYPKSWERNTTQIKAARALIAERGLEQVLKAIDFYKKNSHRQFIPEISTPYDLDTKWEKLLSFKDKAH